MVLRSQEIFEKGFFVGVESDPGLDKYPQSEIESGYHSNKSLTNRNDDVTIAAVVQYDVDHAMEAKAASIKKQEGCKKKLTVQEQL